MFARLMARACKGDLARRCADEVTVTVTIAVTVEGEPPVPDVVVVASRI